MTEITQTKLLKDDGPFRAFGVFNGSKLVTVIIQDSDEQTEIYPASDPVSSLKRANELNPQILTDVARLLENHGVVVDGLHPLSDLDKLKQSPLFLDEPEP